MIVFIPLSNIQHVIIEMEFLSEDSVIRKLYLPVQWLIMPLFYLHVDEVIFEKKTKHSSRLYLHVPVGFVIILHVVHFFYNSSRIPKSAMPNYYKVGLLLYVNLASFLFNSIILYLIYKMLTNSDELTKKLPRKKIKNADDIGQF